MLKNSFAQSRGVAAAVCLSAMVAGPVVAEPTKAAASKHFPQAEIVAEFAPPGESNVRSSFRLAEGVALIGTEETGDIYKSEDAGQTWRKTIDTDELWEVSDVRNFIRAQDGRLFATTSEPAFVLRSADDGETWEIAAKPKSSRTVGIVELDSGTILVGLRRSENDKISVLRSEDGFETFDWIAVSDTLPRQNTTCLFDLGGGVVLTGVGYEASGKVFRSEDEGQTWTQTADFPDARDLMNFFRVGDKIYVMASGIATLYVSDDGGKSWEKSAQIWEKGFLGQHAAFEHGGRTFHILAGTDQRAKTKRHVLLISDDAAQTWHEWIELATDVSGGASNLAVIDDHTIVVGTGNHAVQGKVYTVGVK